jgi:hypothetical protein
VLGVLRVERPTLVVSRQCCVTSGGQTPPPSLVTLIPDREQSYMNLSGRVFFSSISVFTESVLTWRQSRKSILIGFGTYSKKMNTVKVVDNFDGFPASINTPSCWNFQFLTEGSDLTNLEFESIPKCKLRKLGIPKLQGAS